MRQNNVNQLAIQQLICARLPGLLAIYAFGSQIDGAARPDSDLDLAEHAECEINMELEGV